MCLTHPIAANLGGDQGSVLRNLGLTLRLPRLRQPLFEPVVSPGGERMYHFPECDEWLLGRRPA